MLTKDILFGMNILTLVGLILTGFGLTLRRMARASLPLCFAAMASKTALRPRGRPLECRAAGRGVRGRDRRVPRRGPGAAARVPAAVAGASHPERCVEAYYLRRTRFETIAQQKLRRRQLTEDGNVEIGGRDLGYCVCFRRLADIRQRKM
jgi:hypothetical protein